MECVKICNNMNDKYGITAKHIFLGIFIAGENMLVNDVMQRWNMLKLAPSFPGSCVINYNWGSHVSGDVIYKIKWVKLTG